MSDNTVNSRQENISDIQCSHNTNPTSAQAALIEKIDTLQVNVGAIRTSVSLCMEQVEKLERRVVAIERYIEYKRDMELSDKVFTDGGDDKEKILKF